MILVAWLITTPCAAQLRIQNFGIAEGLPQSQVPAMAEDSHGYLWLATLGGGLSRFDGKTFETFTTNDGLISNFIWDLFIDPNDRIWMATNKGISMFDGIAFHNIEIRGHTGVYVNSIFGAGDDVLYLTQDGQLGRVWYDSVMNDRPYKVINDLNSIHRSVSGKTFVLHGVHDHLNLTVYDIRDSVTMEITEFTAINSTFEYNNKTVISTNTGLFTYDSKHLSRINYSNVPVYSFDDEKKYFIGVNGSRIATIDSKGKILRESDPVNYSILSNLTDREGNLWLGTDQGLFQIYSYTFENLLADKDHGNAVLAICDHNNKLWVGGTYQGLKVYEKNRLEGVYDLGSKNKNYVSVIKEDRKGNLWLGSLGGIARFDNGKFVWQNEDVIRSAAAFDFDKENNILVAGVYSGLFVVKNGIATGIPELKSISVWCVKYDLVHDSFVIGTNVGLKVYTKGKISSVDAKDLIEEEISSFDWLDENTLAVGTFDDGVFMYSFKDNSVKRVSTSNGLASNTIFFVFRDQDRIWVGTEKGIDLVTYDVVKRRPVDIEHFDDADGLIGRETNMNAVIKADSVLLFGLVKGLYSYKEHKIERTEYKLHFEEIDLFYKPYFDSVYSFKHNQNHLTFLFSKVNKRKPSKYFYTYKLSEFDQIWSQPSQLNSVTYSNLPPGVYSLEVKAIDRTDSFVFDKISFRFEILPAFYQTIYFRISMVFLAIVVTLLITWFIYKAKANRAIAIQTIKDNENTRLRKEIARDFHDELGNQVARMINYVGLLRISKKLEKEIYETLNAYSQNILNGTKDFVWALDPKNNDLGSVLIHLRDFGEKMFSEKNIEFSFHGDLVYTKLPLGYGRQINLIFKEAMTNAFRHANARAVDLRSSINSLNELCITLSDDGGGASETEITNAERGIGNMKVRAQKIGAEIQIRSNGQGTVVELSVVIPDTVA